jgi:hypothetical protein
MEDAWRIYSAQHEHRLVDYEFCSLVVQANALEQLDQAHASLPDFVSYSGRLRTREELFCTSLAIIPTEGTDVTLANSEITVTDATGRPVDYVMVPARDPSSGTKRPALLFFTPPLPANSGPYTLELNQRVPGFMSKLLTDRRDELFIDTKKASGEIGLIDLVLHVPNSLAAARLIPDEQYPSGRGMTADEVKPYRRPPGFRTLGWRAERFPSGQRFRVEVII